MIKSLEIGNYVWACLCVFAFSNCSSNDYPETESALVVDSTYIDDAKVAERKSPVDKYPISFLSENNDIWEEINNTKIQPIKNWMSTNHLLGDLNNTILFYPFGGPDILYSYSLFPDKTKYILGGLEKIGTLPDFASYSEARKSEYLKYINNAIYSPRKLGFFRTRTMIEDFKSQKLDGVIHILLYYLENLNLNILDINKYDLDKFGNLINQSDPKHKSGQVLHIQTQDDHGIVKDFYYLKYDLSNKGLINNPEVLFFVNSFGHKTTYLKSTSYLLFSNRFSIVRDLILDQSEDIIQDDSGIPYGHLNNKKWDLNLFGKYTRTLKVFSHRFQKELSIDFKSESTRPLPFKIGYSSLLNEGHIILAHRRDPQEKSYLEYATKEPNVDINTSIPFASSTKIKAVQKASTSDKKINPNDGKYVSYGLYKNVDNANKAKAVLKQKGLKVTVHFDGHRLLNRVMAGPYDDSEISAILNQVKGFKPTAFIYGGAAIN